MLKLFAVVALIYASSSVASDSSSSAMIEELLLNQKSTNDADSNARDARGPSLQAAVQKIAELEEQNTELKSKAREQNNGRIGEGLGTPPLTAARCSAVKTGTTAGTLGCGLSTDPTAPQQDRCFPGPVGTTASQWTTNEADCKAYWDGDNGVECKDGPIGWEGVAVVVGTSGELTWAWCAAWDSIQATMGLTSASNDQRTNTKMKAGHVHGMEVSTGVLIMKRTWCDANWSCRVHKTGKCFDAARAGRSTADANVYTHKYNNGMTTTLNALDTKWAGLIVADLKAGIASPCNTADQLKAKPIILAF